MKDLKDDPLWKRWYAQRPRKIRELIDKLPPWECYRGANGRGHYALMSYEEQKDGSVSVKAAHGRDSFLPGVYVFGMKPETLVLCGCGRWRPPTPAQAEATWKRIEAEVAARKRMH